MARIPTKESGGKANLDIGAMGPELIYSGGISKPRNPG